VEINLLIMDYTYEILRLEYLKDRNLADEIFLHLSINHVELGEFNWPHWIQGENAQLVIADETNLTLQLETIIAEAIAAKILAQQEEESND